MTMDRQQQLKSLRQAAIQRAERSPNTHAPRNPIPWRLTLLALGLCALERVIG